MKSLTWLLPSVPIKWAVLSERDGLIYVTLHRKDAYSFQVKNELLFKDPTINVSNGVLEITGDCPQYEYLTDKNDEGFNCNIRVNNHKKRHELRKKYLIRREDIYVKVVHYFWRPWKVKRFDKFLKRGYYHVKGDFKSARRKISNFVIKESEHL